MSGRISRSFMVSAAPNELDALLSAIADAIAALVTWDIPAFQSAIVRQSEICDRIALHPDLPLLPATTSAREIQDLNRIYERLLQHSVHWTQTIHHILRASGDTFPRHSSVHFRG